MVDASGRGAKVEGTLEGEADEGSLGKVTGRRQFTQTSQPSPQAQPFRDPFDSEAHDAEASDCPFDSEAHDAEASDCPFDSEAHDAEASDCPFDSKTHDAEASDCPFDSEPHYA